ncbi:MAG: type II secretion system protein GspN [SAR324 cluster bacterium]|nr:type II secretion system protein GspN [SAR324 cluster bacterium]
MGKFLKGLAASLCGLALVLLLVWLQISPEKLSAFAKYQLEKVFPGLRAELGPIETNLAGVTLQHATLYTNRKNQALVSLEQVHISLAPWNLVQGEAHFDMEIYGGEISGFLNFLTYQVTANGREVQFALNSYVRKLQVLDSKPKLDFELDFALPKQSGTLSLTIQNIKTTKLVAQKTGLLVDLPRTKLDNIALKLDFGRNKAEVDLKTKGDVTGGVQGMVNFASIKSAAKGKMQLNLTIRERLSAPYTKELGFLGSLLENFQQPNGLLAIKISGSSYAPKIDKL